jgi:hypothetical protein
LPPSSIPHRGVDSPLSNASGNRRFPGEAALIGEFDLPKNVSNAENGLAFGSTETRASERKNHMTADPRFLVWPGALILIEMVCWPLKHK